MFRYILQPRMAPGFTQSDGKINLPVYKTNRHLTLSLLSWAHDNGHRKFVKNLMKNLENYAKGNNAEGIDITSYERGRMDKVDWNKLGKMSNPYKTLAKHLNIFFADPTLQAKLDGLLIRNTNPTETIRGNDGEKIPVKKGFHSSVPRVDSYWSIESSKEGFNC